MGLRSLLMIFINCYLMLKSFSLYRFIVMFQIDKLCIYHLIQIQAKQTSTDFNSQTFIKICNEIEFIRPTENRLNMTSWNK